MKICLKKNLKLGNYQLLKHEEFWVAGIEWSDKGDFYYLVDFPDKTRQTLSASDVDLLNC